MQPVKQNSNSYIAVSGVEEDGRLGDHRYESLIFEGEASLMTFKVCVRFTN